MLLTDQEDKWSEFPGEVFRVKSSHSRSSRHISKNARYLTKIAGGYWIKTYERLFVLQELASILDTETAVIHLESDVVIQDEFILESAVEDIEVNKIAVPRFSNDEGIASILIAPNIDELVMGLKILEELGAAFPEICTNDMRLLGLALNKGYISELPTWVDNKAGSTNSKEYFLFEGAAIGQYLFGRDPIHNDGRRISGYENPNFPIKLSELTWGIKENSIYAENTNSKFWFVNLHIHSKEEIAPPEINPDRWAQLIGEANGKLPRLETYSIPELIHSRGYTFSVKAEIFIRTLIRSKNPKSRKKS